ncbi:hypothetical protein INT46_010922 [Mucor plumbeus]|uniref:BTB domain-containing protein n=1 Tax=Mucor plumbeus TaxID=97098 RepID=A0A8H7RIB6_9FUNG|nr:hypothetical protein INT46_010922 [Mucor plumbeus]
MGNNFNLINLTVGGKKFITYYDTLKQSTYFQGLIQNNAGAQAAPIEGEEDKHFFIDRDGDIFEDILHYLRSYEIRQRSQEQLKKLEHESTFYGFDELKAKVNQALYNWVLDKEGDVEFSVEAIEKDAILVDSSFSENLPDMHNDNSIIVNKFKYFTSSLTSETKLITKSIKKK